MNFGNLGVALGAGVDEYHRQQEESRKQTAESRADAQFKQQQAQYERQMKQQSMQDALMEEARQHNGYLQQLNSLPDDQLGPFAQSMIEKYNKHPAYANGMFANMTSVDGKPMIVHGNMAKLGGVQMIPVTRQDLASALGQMGSDLRQRLAMTSPEGYTQYFDKEREFSLKGREVGAKERANEIDNEWKRLGGTYHTIHTEDSQSRERVAAANNATSIQQSRISAGPAWGRLDFERRIRQENELAIKPYLDANASIVKTINAGVRADGTPLTDRDIAGLRKQYDMNTHLAQMSSLGKNGQMAGGLNLPGEGGSGGQGGIKGLTLPDAKVLEEMVQSELPAAIKASPKNTDPKLVAEKLRTEILQRYGYLSATGAVRGAAPQGAVPGMIDPYATVAPASAPQQAPMGKAFRDQSLDFMAGVGGVRFGSNGLPISDAPSRYVGDPTVDAASAALRSRLSNNAFGGDMTYGMGGLNLGIPRNQR